MRIAWYDLATMPTTFDFAVFAVAAKTLGYDEVRFAAGRGIAGWKYDERIAWRRWANIVLPLCQLARLPYSVATEMPAACDEIGYGTGVIEQAWRAAGRVEKLRSGIALDRGGYVTITMRRSFRNAWRNSNLLEWRKVQDWIEARGEEVMVLEECEDMPLDIGYRLALYEHAKMNLAVGNGPMVLCWLSEAPYLTFQLPAPPDFRREREELVAQWSRLGFPVGSQLSFRNERQRIVWGPDDADAVLAAWSLVFGGDAVAAAA